MGEISVPVIGKTDFIANKRAAGRAKDFLDLELLRADPVSKKRPTKGPSIK